MRLLLALGLILWAFIDSSYGVSTKMDFGEEPPIYFSEEPTFVPSNKKQNATADEDVEVKHTIVVTTSLNKNNNRRGITNNRKDGALTFTIDETPKNQQKDDSGEVPVIKSYKSVETTDIKTPDTRYKTKIYPDAIFVNRNIRDDADIYPNVIAYPLNWKPANFYRNINYWNQNSERDPYSASRRRNQNPNQGKLHRKITDDGMKEFYCRKCAELSTGQGSRGCGVQQRSANIPASNSWYETTTSKMKIDGKLAKLN